jgi:hypothetical protein
MQAAINATIAAGNARLVIEGHLYLVSGALTALGPIQIVGTYSGPGWGLAVPPAPCTTGIRQQTVNVATLTLSGSGSTLKDVCFDASGINDATGTAVQINTPSGAKLSNVLVEGNQFNGFCNSVGVTAVPGGIGQVIGTRLIRNEFQPANNAGCHSIWVGRLSTGGLTTNTSILDNAIYCAFDTPSNQSVSVVDGIFIQDSGGSTVRGNQITACLYGTHIAPGANQATSGFLFSNTVVGDSSKNNDLLIDTAATTASVIKGRIVGSWMSAATGTSVVIQNTGGGVIRGINFAGDSIYPRQGQNAVVIAAGDDISFTGGSACANNVSASTMFDISTAGSVGLHDMIIGACDSAITGYQVDFGVFYHPSTAGQISITGNQFYDQAIQAIKYQPTVQPTNAVISNNVGVDDLTTFMAHSASTVNLPVFPTFAMDGVATISTFTGGWPGRCVNIIPAAAWSVVTGGNINPGFTAGVGVMKRACYTGSTWYFQ